MRFEIKFAEPISNIRLGSVLVDGYLSLSFAVLYQRT
jgi:hypothetical protein